MEQTYEHERSGNRTDTRDRKCHGTKRHGMKCGVLLIVIGFLWLMAYAGWVPEDLFWPLAMILVGLSICVPSLWPRIKGAT